MSLSDERSSSISSSAAWAMSRGIPLATSACLIFTGPHPVRADFSLAKAPADRASLQKPYDLRLSTTLLAASSSPSSLRRAFCISSRLQHSFLEQSSCRLSSVFSSSVSISVFPLFSRRAGATPVELGLFPSCRACSRRSVAVPVEPGLLPLSWGCSRRPGAVPVELRLFPLSWGCSR